MKLRIECATIKTNATAKPSETVSVDKKAQRHN